MPLAKGCFGWRPSERQNHENGPTVARTINRILLPQAFGTTNVRS
jgi:hypothetical protein